MHKIPGWIIGTLSKEALELVCGLYTTYSAWEALKNSYAQNSQERGFMPRQQLTYLHKDQDKTIVKHICTFKSLCNNLPVI